MSIEFSKSFDDKFKMKRFELLQSLFKNKLVVFLSAFIIFIGCWFVYLQTKKSTVPSAAAPDEKSIPVVVANAEKKTIRRTFKTHTYLQPWKEVVLKPPTQTTVRQIHVQVGQIVSKGQILISLGSELQELKAELEGIEVQLRNIDITVTRALAKNSYLSRNEYKQKELENKASKIKMRMNQLESSTFLKAPVAGKISEINMKEGDYIDQSSALYQVKMIDDSKYRAFVHLPVEVATQLTTSNKAFLSAAEKSSDGQASASPVVGEIVSISPTVDVKTGTVASEVVLNQVPRGWLPGMFVEIEYLLLEKQDVIAIPQEALVYENSRPYVYVVKNDQRGPASETSIDQVKKMSVVLGEKDGAEIEVVQGLEDLDQIVVQGQSAVTDGSKVEVIQ